MNVESSNSVSTVNEDESKKIEEVVSQIIGDEKEINRFNNAMEDLRKKVGLLPLESPRYKPTTTLEEIIYNMRWNPGFFTNCDIMELHEYEMILCSHITWVKSRENRWLTAYEIEKRSFERALAHAANFYKTIRSVEERKSEALYRSKVLSDRYRQLQIYKLYANQCENISGTFIQMDNSLKKLIDTRKIEFEASKRTK